MPELTLGVHRVGVATSYLGLAQVPVVLKIGEDGLRGTLRDPYSCRDITHTSIGITVHVDQYVTVIGQKGPLPPRVRHQSASHRRQQHYPFLVLHLHGG